MSGASIVQRGKTFSVVAYAGIDPETKKERRRWFSGFKTRREAEQFRITLAHHAVFSAGAGPYGVPRLRTQDAIEAWIDEREGLGRIRASTAGTYKTLNRAHITPWIGHFPIVRLSPQAIQALYGRLLKELSPTTVRQIGAILSACFNDLVRRGLILRNPCANTTKPSPAAYEPTILTPEQIHAYLEDARDTATPALYALYITACGTGLRLGELLACRETDLDLAAGILRVRQSLSRAGRNPVFNRPKTDRGLRTVLLPDEARQGDSCGSAVEEGTKAPNGTKVPRCWAGVLRTSRTADQSVQSAEPGPPAQDRTPEAPSYPAA